MDINKDEISNLCKEACEEFNASGFKQDVHPRTLKKSYNISKHANGSWFKSTKTSLHEPAININLDFTYMPSLKKLIDAIDEIDAEFKKIGGRIFITESLVYKIKKGTEYPLFYGSTQVLKSQNRFAKLCEEIANLGHEKDRHRAEDTYILTKATNGEWSISFNHENISATKKVLSLSLMPQLKSLAAKIIKLDPTFHANGGRIFITPTRIYRIKNKIEIDFKIRD